MKYGFVYIWRDKKHRRFYVGRHWGTIDDGYVCSSRMMRQAFKRRPHDFKRRIILTTNCKEDLILKEQHYLNLIKKDDLGKKYYNISTRANAPSSLGFKHSEETKKKRSDAMKGKTWKVKDSSKMGQHWKNKKQSEETKKKRSDAMKGKTWKVKDSSKTGLHMKNKVHVIDINGHKTTITKEEFKSQKIGDSMNWKYVSIMSKVATSRIIINKINQEF